MALTQSFIDVAGGHRRRHLRGHLPAAHRKRNAANPSVMEGVRRVAVMLDAAARRVHAGPRAPLRRHGGAGDRLVQ